MNKNLKNYAREELKTNLALLPDSWQEKFKLMYGRDNGKRSVEDAKATPINDIVDFMPEEKLDWAMQQVTNSLNKL